MAECYWSEESYPERKREELRSGQHIENLCNMSYGQNLSSTLGVPEFVAQNSSLKYQPQYLNKLNI
jgi:hypothetical protein